MIFEWTRSLGIKEYKNPTLNKSYYAEPSLRPIPTTSGNCYKTFLIALPIESHVSFSVEAMLSFQKFLPNYNYALWVQFNSS